MEMLRTALFTACVTAVISSAVMMIAPDKRKRELRLICTLVLICSIAAGFAGTKAPDMSMPDTHRLEFDYNNMLITRSRTALEDRVTEKLISMGHAPGLVCIQVSLDQYNYISADRADIYLDCTEAPDTADTESAVREIVGDDCEVNIYDTSAESAAEG